VVDFFVLRSVFPQKNPNTATLDAIPGGDKKSPRILLEGPDLGETNALSISYPLCLSSRWPRPRTLSQNFLQPLVVEVDAGETGRQSPMPSAGVAPMEPRRASRDASRVCHPTVIFQLYRKMCCVTIKKKLKPKLHCKHAVTLQVCWDRLLSWSCSFLDTTKLFFFVLVLCEKNHLIQSMHSFSASELVALCRFRRK
jgi:hypothetical protein